jgi:hypothetical protein
VNHKNLEDYSVEQINDREFNQVVLFDDTALMASSSRRVLFYQQQEDKFRKGVIKWQKYHQIDKWGQLYHFKGKNEFQITSAEHLFFYKMNKKTYVPELVNAMKNYMQCTHSITGDIDRSEAIDKQNNVRRLEQITLNYT